MISVVIPVYNQVRQLEWNLNCFKKQKIEDKYEIIIIDDGSDVRYDKVISKFQDVDFKITFIRNSQNKGRSYTRNRGIEKCSGDIIVFCDADRYPGPDFLYNHYKNIESVQEDKVVSIGAILEDLSLEPYGNIKDKVIRNATYYKIINHLFDDEGKTDSGIPWIATLSGNMAIKGLKNDVFFDENLTEWGFEHFEFGYRLYLMDYTFTLCRSAANYHIAHKRINNFYMENMRKSIEKLKYKHPGLEMEMFEKFIFSEISLQEFEKVIGKEATWYRNDTKPVYNKIISF